MRGSCEEENKQLGSVKADYFSSSWKSIDTSLKILEHVTSTESLQCSMHLVNCNTKHPTLLLRIPLIEHRITWCFIKEKCPRNIFCL